MEPKSNLKKKIIEQSSQNQKTAKKRCAIIKEIFSRSDKQSFKVRIYRNLVMVAFSFLLYNSTQTGINSLQASLNSSNMLGLLVLLASSFATMIFCLYLPIVSLQWFGFKLSFIIAQVVAVTYVVANQFPVPQFLIPSGVLHAAANVILLPLHVTFIALLAKQYSEHTNGNPVFILVKFFAINFSISHLSSTLGNLIPALVLNQDLFTGHRHETHISNSTNSSCYKAANLTRATTIKAQTIKICGSSSCPNNYSSIQKPPKTEIFQIVIIYSCMLGLAMLILVFFMDNFKSKDTDIGDLGKSLKNYFRLFKTRKMLQLIPLFVFNGVLLAFIQFDLSLYYISCAYGINVLSIFHLVSGIASLIGSILIIKIVKVMNKTLLTCLVILAILGVTIYLNFWTSNASVFIVYGIGVLLGIYAAVWNAYIHAIVGITFYDKQTLAFTLFHFIMGFVGLLSNIGSLFLCSKHKIYIVCSLAVVAFFTMIGLEIEYQVDERRKKKKSNDQTDQQQQNQIVESDKLSVEKAPPQEIKT